ncbi:MAG: phosphodiester glycosidase family protein [Anaerolineales bacterium]
MIRRWVAGVVALGLLGCNAAFLNSVNDTPEATPNVTPTVSMLTEDGWDVVAPGMAYRVFRVEPPYTQRAFDMPVVRIDPASVEFRVHYEPGEWYTIAEWRDRLNEPLLIVNANFFTEMGRAVGLVVSVGQTHGQSFEGFGGMFQVTEDEARVRSLVEEPYEGGDFLQAVQGFPMFVEPGGRAANTGPGFDDLSRRTMIAQDDEGRVLILTTPAGLLTLRQAMNWLLAAPLNIDVAFGLDGGKSVGLFVQARPEPLFYPSLDPIPVVVAVYPR